MNLSAASKIAFKLASIEAAALQSQFIDNEHLFLGLLKSEDVLPDGRTNPPGLGDAGMYDAFVEISAFRERLASLGLECKTARRTLRGILSLGGYNRGVFTGHRTDRCRKVFSDTEQACHAAGTDAIGMDPLMRVILVSGSAPIEKLFELLNVDGRALAEGDGGATGNRSSGCESLEADTERSGGRPGVVTANAREVRRNTPLLERFGRDITALARSGELDELIGRKQEIGRITQILLQRKKNNPLLVGDAGVGKTCIVEGLAIKIVNDESDERIRDMRIIELDTAALLGGTRYRGDFEERVNGIIKEATNDPDIVLFVDEIHSMVNAGTTSDGSLSIGNMLKPALASGKLKCIGATTIAEYRKYIEKDKAFERRFQVVWVDEPSREEAISILFGVREKYEKFYSMSIPDAVVVKAVDLSIRFLRDYRLPDKAIDTIDQACAAKLVRGRTVGSGCGRAALGVEDVARTVSERSRVPIQDLMLDEDRQLMNMETEISRRIFGQDRAIRQIADVIRAGKAGMVDPRRPKGVLLFCGPTGVGKTEAAKALASFLFNDESRLITFDMCEYQDKHMLYRLIGSPPGYIGYEDEGQLTGKVRTNPHSVILFDDVDKAHPDVCDIFLHIFDEGRLTDGQGRIVSFSETIIVLTMNTDNESLSGRQAIGFKPAEPPDDKTSGGTEYEERTINAAKARLKPEIFNRLHKVVAFCPLNKETMFAIAASMLSKLNGRLAEKQIRLEMDEGAYNCLLERGDYMRYGARELQRAFDQCIVQPIVKLILSGSLEKDALISVTSGKDGLKLLQQRIT